MSGRVEHVVSFQAAHFASVTELTAFMGRVLTADPHETGNTGHRTKSAVCIIDYETWSERRERAIPRRS
jgi:hypothetical protein